MLYAFLHINWLAVLAASVVHFALGGVWFTALFAKPYAEALGIADRPPEKPAPIFLIGPFVCSAVTIAATAFLLNALGVTDLRGALVLGAVIGLGYLVPMTVNVAINPLFPKPFAYALVNAPMFVIGSLLASAILVLMS